MNHKPFDKLHHKGGLGTDAPPVISRNNDTALKLGKDLARF
jgi:hypothetical protein